MAGYIAIMIHIVSSQVDRPVHLAVVDLSGRVFAPLEAALDERVSNGARKYVLEQVPSQQAEADKTVRELRQDVLSRKLDGVIVIPRDVMEEHSAALSLHTSVNLDRDRLRSRLREVTAQVTAQVTLRQSGVPTAVLHQSFAPFKITYQELSPKPGGSKREVLAYIVGGILYGTLLLYGIGIMRGIVEEKQSRVAEVILSSVDAFTLLLGKLLGLAAAGLTQLGIWAICIVPFTIAQGAWVILPRIEPQLYLYLLIFFLLGFLTYASLYAAVGSMVSSESDAQQMQMPITMLLVVAFVLAPELLNNPSGWAAALFSEIPFFAPILMTMRVVLVSPPLWQIALCVVLSVATVVVLIKLSAKIYRVGILMTGKRPTLPEIVRWLSYA